MGSETLTLFGLGFDPSRLKRDLLLSNLDRATTNLGNVIVGSLQHAMLSQDSPEIQGIMDNIAKQEGIRGVLSMNNQSEIRFAPQRQLVGARLSFSDPGCAGCHSRGSTQHPNSILFTTAQGERVFPQLQSDQEPTRVSTLL
jgi:hypothetical protein